MRRLLSILFALVLLCGAMLAVAPLQADAEASEDFQYTVSNGEATITKYIGDDKNVIIPETIEGYPVKYIGDSAFKSYNWVIQSVKIPNSVTSIGRGAFAGCYDLRNITIPDSVTSIGDYVFVNCEGMASIKLSKNLTSIPNYAFSGCKNLNSVTIPDGVTSIGNMAFDACMDLRTIIIPAGVTSMGFNAFEETYSLTDIYCEAESEPDGWDDHWYNNCDANVVWGYKPTDENLAFSGASITLFDDLTVNFKADATLFGTYTDPYVVFTLGGAETTVTEYTVEDGMYVFAFDGILPNQMNDTITATLCATADGTVYKGEALSYSVATYCYNMLTKYSDDTYLRTLLVDILNYGAETQLYTAYNTGALANAGLTDEQKAWASADRAFVSVEDIDFATIADPTAEWHGAGLDLSESIAVRFEFSAQSTAGLTAQITCGDAVWNVTEFGKNGAYDTVCVSINAGYMSEPIYVTLYDGETAVSNTVCYSIESYASTYSNDAELGALVRAMIKYGDSASAYIS